MLIYSPCVPSRSPCKPRWLFWLPLHPSHPIHLPPAHGHTRLCCVGHRDLTAPRHRGRTGRSTATASCTSISLGSAQLCWLWAGCQGQASKAQALLAWEHKSPHPTYLLWAGCSVSEPFVGEHVQGVSHYSHQQGTMTGSALPSTSARGSCFWSLKK